VACSTAACEGTNNVNSAYSLIRWQISSLCSLNKILGFEDHTQTDEVYLAIRRLKRSKCLD
jgi:integrase/recombinase XerD